MLKDAYGFKKIYLATGFTDLRRGMEGLAAIIRFQFNLILMIKILYFFFVADAPTASKDFSGKEMDFYFCISAWIMGHSAGRVHRPPHWKSHQSSIAC